jgi:hypothetical protein
MKVTREVLEGWVRDWAFVIVGTTLFILMVKIITALVT